MLIANTRKGSCSFPLGQNQWPTNHATVQSIVNELGLTEGVVKPCCVPNKLYSISLLYYDDSENVILKQYDDMANNSNIPAQYDGPDLVRLFRMTKWRTDGGSKDTAGFQLMSSSAERDGSAVKREWSICSVDTAHGRTAPNVRDVTDSRLQHRDCDR
ncbi:bone morphogenetic protein 7-like [Tropilaelaps mercedesae]|uniref:Bone morphogenetic protein 7-like n=1 Tax=Tropilaelaps mercedesae TaxID=418985 RepID=A0A1V9X108_9ACAR|nr:bone morphogenetic protein 7-like [Tropilaelaps mercedesae]